MVVVLVAVQVADLVAELVVESVAVLVAELVAPSAQALDCTETMPRPSLGYCQLLHFHKKTCPEVVR